MSNSLVLYESRPPAAILTLNRPDRRNAISRGLIVALTAAFEQAANDVAARCVVLTGAGTVFCAGMDLAELQESLDTPAEASPVWDDALRLARLYDLIYRLPKPTIAAVQGAAVAGGAGLMTVCDLAVTVPAAKFGYPEARRGLVAAMVMPHLLRARRRAHGPLSAADRRADFRRRSAACRVGERNRAGGSLDGASHGAGQRLRREWTASAGTDEGFPQPVLPAIVVDRRRRPGKRRPAFDRGVSPGTGAFFEKRPAPWASGK